MSPLLAAATSFSTGSGGSPLSLTATLPSGASAGDLIVIPCFHGAGDGTTFSSSGFTAVTALSATNVTAQTLYRMLDGSSNDPGATFAVDASINAHFGGLVFCITGCPMTGFQDPAFTSGGNFISGTSVSAPSITTTSNGDLLIWVGAADGVGDSAVAPTVSLPSSPWVNCGAQATCTPATGVPFTLRAASRVQSTAGVTGSVAGTVTAHGNGFGAGVLLGVKGGSVVPTMGILSALAIP